MARVRWYYLFESKATVVSPESSSEGVPIAVSEGANNPTTIAEDQIPIPERDGSVNNPTYESEGGQFQPRQVTFADPQIAKEAKHLDPNIDLIRQKQHRLFVFHEKYGHLPFPRLQLMARAGLIPKELANVDPPTCPGCAYGKAHRKP